MTFRFKDQLNNKIMIRKRENQVKLWKIKGRISKLKKGSKKCQGNHSSNHRCNNAKIDSIMDHFLSMIQLRQWTKQQKKAKHPNNLSAKLVDVRIANDCCRPRRDGSNHRKKDCHNSMECRSLSCRCNREC